MLQVTYGTIKFWDTNTLSDSVLTSVLTSVYTFSGNAVNTIIISPRGPTGARKEGRKQKHTYIPYNSSQNLIGYGIFTLTQSCKTLI